MITRGKISALLTAAAAALLLVALAPAAHSARGVTIFDEDPDADCLELLPDGTAVQQKPGRVGLEVLVLLDDVALERAAAVMHRARDAYLPLDIDLTWQFRTVDVPGSSIDAQSLIDASKHAVGGRAPQGIDAVYTITSKAITDAAGMADCIGGVRYPEYSFAVGEDLQYADLSPKVVAHELGHLLGAHHHYSNCVQSFLSDDINACTLMTPIVDFASIDFGSVEAMVVRGHAEDFARP